MRSSDEDQLAGLVIGKAIEVHRVLGPGLLELSYLDCLCFELVEAAIAHQREVLLPVTYKGRVLSNHYRTDLIVQAELNVELKAVEKVLPVHKAQVLTYMKLSGIHKGLLLNFHEALLKDGISRFRL